MIVMKTYIKISNNYKKMTNRVKVVYQIMKNSQKPKNRMEVQMKKVEILIRYKIPLKRYSIIKTI